MRLAFKQLLLDRSQARRHDKTASAIARINACSFP
jgi:hypothetical protein